MVSERKSTIISQMLNATGCGGGGMMIEVL
jgi:hypothetical protein